MQKPHACDALSRDPETRLASAHDLSALRGDPQRAQQLEDSARNLKTTEPRKRWL